VSRRSGLPPRSPRCCMRPATCGLVLQVHCCVLVTMSATGASGRRLRALGSKQLSAQGRQHHRDPHSTTVMAVGSPSCTLPSVDARPPSLHEAMSPFRRRVQPCRVASFFGRVVDLDILVVIRTPAWRSCGKIIHRKAQHSSLRRLQAPEPAHRPRAVSFLASEVHKGDPPDAQCSRRLSVQLDSHIRHSAIYVCETCTDPFG
jgi:hypothetical protein